MTDSLGKVPNVQRTFLYTCSIAIHSVVCQMLGFDWGEPVSSDTYGEGTGEILLDDVQCHGTEMNIGHCEFEALHNCQHSEDAGVSCHYDHGEKHATLYITYTLRAK